MTNVTIFAATVFGLCALAYAGRGCLARSGTFLKMPVSAPGRIAYPPNGLIEILLWMGTLGVVFSLASNLVWRGVVALGGPLVPTISATVAYTLASGFTLAKSE